MHILPPLETVKDIAATQQYDVLPLSCEILSDFITPIEAMRIHHRNRPLPLQSNGLSCIQKSHAPPSP